MVTIAVPVEAPVAQDAPLVRLERALVGWLDVWLGACCCETVDVAILVGSRIGERIEIYRWRHGGLPARLEDAFGPDPVPTDPWGHAWTWHVPGQERAFELVSPGRDGRPGTRDDVRLSF